MASLFDWHARLLERVAEFVSHWIGTTQPDRLTWQPNLDGAHSGRSVLEQVRECVVVNQMFAQVLRGEGVSQGWDEEAGPTFTSAADAQAQLVDSAKELAQAVRGLTEADLDRVYETAFGPMPGRVIIELPLGNMHYHAGQINYIQTLYGDKEFSVPPTFAAP